MVVKNKNLYPPFDVNPDVTKTGVARIDLQLNKDNIKSDNEFKNNKELAGYYTLAIKSSSQSKLLQKTTR
jgi:hypothetical protein